MYFDDVDPCVDRSLLEWSFRFGIRTVDAVDDGLSRKSRDKVAVRTLVCLPWWCGMFYPASAAEIGSVPVVPTIDLHHEAKMILQCMV